MTSLALAFRRLHEAPLPLLLPNCWDAGSARLLASVGAPAVATTSAGLAWSNGYPDGDALPVEVLVSAIKAITRVLDVPLTVDVEGGYSDDPELVGETVARVLDAGAVGINLEDGSGSADALMAKVASARQAAVRAGVPLFINSRTDVYLRRVVPEGERVQEVLQRARRYREAGADGLFVPALIAPEEMRAIAAGAGLMLNVMARPGLPPALELGTVGVRRVSSGSALAEVAMGKVAERAARFLHDGSSEALVEGAMPYPRVNALFAGR